MSQRFYLEPKSGTCNVCSAPCSSCIHRNGAHMGSKGNEFSDESCHDNAFSQDSINEGDVLPLGKSRECENQQQAASETGNQVSVSFSHDSLTQNAESKVFTRFSSIADPSEDVMVLQKLTSGRTVAKDQSSHNPQCDFNQKASCIEDSKGVEGRDDLTSCVSTSKNSSVVEDRPNRHIDSKNISCSSISVGSKVATANLDEDNSVKFIYGDTVVPGGCADNSIQQVPPSLSIDISSHKLEPLETPVNENIGGVAGSLKVEALNSHCQSHASLCHSNAKGLEENALLQPLEKLPESLNEYTTSSAKEAGPDIAYGQKSTTYEDSKDNLIGGGCKVTGEISPKTKLEIKEEFTEQLDATFKCSDQTKDLDKSKEMVELPGVQESSLESPSGDETGESDIVEQDVKVCDICGDAGREDLLAVCSRCSDGAEHTYCMREMLKKVPEGEWLCEECKFAVESENRNQSEIDGESGNASSHSSGHSINELPLKLDARCSKADAKATSKVTSSPRVSGKRTAENFEVGSTVKRQALESSIGSPKPNPIRTSALSRDSSFKGLEKGKVRPAHQTSNGIHSSNDFAESARSPSNGSRLQVSKGALLKSNSFSSGSSKPKVKLVDDVPLKQKGAREHASLGMKDGAVRTLGKSMSFKPTNSGRSNGTESRVKMFTPKISQDQDIKGLKHAKDRNTLERKNSSKLDRPVVSSTKISSAVSSPKGYHKLTSRGESSLSSISNNRDLKVGQSDGKLTSLSRSTSNLGRKGTETTHVSGGVSSAELKSNQLSFKEEPSSSSSTVDRPSGNTNGGLQDGLPRSRESTNQVEKTKENFTGNLRQITTTGLRTVACQKCKEVGHDADSCTVASPRASGIQVSTARSSREEMNEGNKLKAAITAAMLKKPGIYKKKFVNVKGEEQSVSNMDANGEPASQYKLSVPSTLRNTIPAEGGLHDGKAVFQSSTSDSFKPMIVNNMEQTASNPGEAADSFKVGDTDPVFASDGKPIVREVSTSGFPAVTICKPVAIPEHEFIWQGNFELHRGGKQPDICAGLQAHVSTSASRKVIEVTNKFPHNVSFSEVPRLSTWPQQFHECGAKEENIALYFFAKDLESYQRNYKWLVESLIKNDLALKGNLDGVELLVFPSNQLPEKFQRWNMLFFLWGVFRGKRATGSDHTSGSSIKLDIPSLNVPPVDTDIPGTLVSSSENHASSKLKDENPSTCDKSFDVVLASDRLSARNSNGDCNIKSEPVDQKCLRTVAVSEQQHSTVDPHSLPKNRTSSSMPVQESRYTNRTMKEASGLDSEWSVDLQPSVRSFNANSGYNEVKKPDTCLDEQKIDTCSHKILPVGDWDVNEVSLDEEKKPDVIDSGKDVVKHEFDLMKDASDASVERNEELNNNWQFSRKRPHIDLGETPLEDSAGPSQSVSWNSAIHSSAAGEGQRKKLNTGIISGVYGYDRRIDEVSKRDGYDLPAEKGYERPCDKKVILEDSGTGEKYFFPVASHNVVKDVQFGEDSISWKGNRPEAHERVPNLELALGGERKPANKGLLPFLAGMVDKQAEKATRVEEEEASLSLSLSFPFPDKEEAAPKTEQRVNTSLLLFGGFPDK